MGTTATASSKQRDARLETAAATLTIINPVAVQASETADAKSFPAAPRLKSFAGKVVGLFWNGKQQGQVALDNTKRVLKHRYPDIEFRDYLGVMGGVLRRASEAQLNAMARECDVVIGTSADCGSCTSWLIHDMCHVEQRGTPALAWTAAQFCEDARWSAKVWGVPDLSLGIVPECFTNNSPERIAEMVDAAIAHAIGALTSSTDREVHKTKRISRDKVGDRELHFTASDPMACWEEMNAAFVENKWSDGFPLIAPTAEKVAALVNGTGLAADHEMGRLEPGFGIATVEKIAANAAMAGCTPKMMPVVIAAVEAALDHRAGWRGVSMSTGPQAPILMVSGPIVDEIGFNSGIAPIGPGSQNVANIAVGRAIRLIMMNIGLSYPGVSDMDTHGTCMKFSYCVAENEARNPWEPHRVVKGFSRESSTVTVNSPFSQTCLYDFENHDAKSLVEVFTSAMTTAAAAMGAAWLTTSRADEGQPAVWRGNPDNVLLLSPDHAMVFKRAGWTLADVKEALYEGCRLPFRKAMLNKTKELFKVVHPHLQWMWNHPDSEISIFGSPDNFDIFVVGGDAGWSTWHDGGSYSITREIKSAAARR